MTMFTRDQIRRFAPLAKADLIEVLVDGSDLLAEAKINTPLRLQHFMAQIATETGGLHAIEENLNYSAERLTQVWPSRFPSLSIAKQYARNPQKLAAKVYGKRLGNKTDLDAWIFRGSGLLQTTGRDNFTKAGRANDPDSLRSPDGALHSALQFWTDNGCNTYADKDDIVGLRRRINGGTNGLAEARTWLVKAKKIFVTATPVEITPSTKLPPARILELQNQLLRLGYIELGRADGAIGSKTVGAISMFQAENGLTVTGRFDDETAAALYTAESRIVDRASSEPTDPTIVKGARTLKNGAMGLLAVSGVSLTNPLAALETIKGYSDRVKVIVAPVQFLADMATQHWMLIAGAGAAAVYFYGRRIERVTIEQHLTGRTA